MSRLWHVDPKPASKESVAVVLVVDDEVRIRDLVRRYLEHDGYQVITALDGCVAFRWRHPLFDRS